MIQLLPVLDSLDAAVGMEGADGSSDGGLREGMSSTRELLLSRWLGKAWSRSRPTAPRSIPPSMKRPRWPRGPARWW